MEWKKKEDKWAKGRKDDRRKKKEKKRRNLWKE